MGEASWLLTIGRPANMWFTPDGVVADLLVYGWWNGGCVMVSPGVSPCPPLFERGAINN